jgi:curved DNA-binding protein CbpA
MPTNDITDYYSILEVSQYAKYREIKAAYRRLALKYHPDRNSSPFSEATIKIINAAFEVLSDRDKRRQYDEKATFNIYHIRIKFKINRIHLLLLVLIVVILSIPTLVIPVVMMNIIIRM